MNDLININPANFFVLSGILQSVLVAFALFFLKSGDAQSNRLLGAFVLTSSLNTLWPLIIDTNIDSIFPSVLWILNSCLLAIGPLIFLYTRCLTHPRARVVTNDLTLFLPFLMELVVQGLFISESIRTGEMIYNVSGFFFFRIADLVAATVSITIYGAKSLKLINTHERWVIGNYSNKKDITLAWLFDLVKYLRVVWIAGMVFEISFILFRRFEMYVMPAYVVLYGLLGVVAYSTYWIGLKGFQYSETVLENIDQKKESVENGGVYFKLTDVELTSLANSIDQLMSSEKLYLHETLSLTMLAGYLRKDPNLISYVLNNKINKSFYDYVNEFRVAAVKSKIGDPAYAHLKIVEVAFDCGFNSKATFNRVFKKVVGQSPSSYRAEHQLPPAS